MNKSDLISAISEKTNVSKKSAEESINAFVEVVSEALKENEKVQL